jgi:hypothetical protein
MTATALPATPLPNQAVAKLRVFGGTIEPPTGGEAQNIVRVGTRFAIDVTMPRMKPEADGRIWASTLVDARALGSTVTMPFPQPGLAIGNPGTPLVNGAGQLGTTINLAGLSAFYVVRKGQFLNVTAGGRLYLYKARADTAADINGLIALPITPPIRRSPAHASTVNLAAPAIEGFLEGNEQAWTHVRARTIGLQFTIAEAG